jgi:hypothetical protein
MQIKLKMKKMVAHVICHLQLKKHAAMKNVLKLTVITHGINGANAHPAKMVILFHKEQGR